MKVVFELPEETYNHLHMDFPLDLLAMSTNVWLEKDDGTIVKLKERHEHDH